jgi:hypothetical protein
MPARDIYFLFNDEDGSYNCHSPRPFPTFMKHSGVTERVLSVDLPTIGDITMTFYDEVSDVLVDASSLMGKLDGSEKGQAALEKLLIEVAEDPAKVANATPEMISRRNLLIELARKYLPPKRVRAILADGRIDATEAAEIKAALDAAKGV